MSRISVEQAHKLLGLKVQRVLKREDIEQAYRQAAKRYHPDSRFVDSRPSATKYIHCQDARHTLIKYYSNPAINMRRVRRPPSTAADVSPAMQHLKYRKYTIGLKFMVLVMVACDGVVENFRSKKEARAKRKS
eukprot:scaffold1519_cov166-Amphora_coffeaeformis.AAC.16